MSSIEEQLNRADIKKALNELPKGLDATYEGMIERIRRQPEAHVRCAEQVLMWLTFAKEPLPATVLQHALAVEIGSKAFDFSRLTEVSYLVSICGGLVTVDAESGIIHLVHYTTHDYLKGSYLYINTNIAKTCLTYLGLEIFDEPCMDETSLIERLNIFAFSRYAAKYWAEHIRGDKEPELQSALSETFDSSGRRDSMYQVQYYFSERWFPFVGSSAQSLLHIVAANGLATVCAGLLDEGPDDNDLYVPSLFTFNQKQPRLMA
jgi:hypothetical protein